MGSNRVKSNMAIAILEKLPFVKGKIFFSHFDVTIIFSSIVQGVPKKHFLRIFGKTDDIFENC